MADKPYFSVEWISCFGKPRLIVQPPANYGSALVLIQCIGGGNFLYQWQQVGISLQVSNSVLDFTGLSGAENFPGTAQAQVLFGDGKAIRVAAQGLQARATVGG